MRPSVSNLVPNQCLDIILLPLGQLYIKLGSVSNIALPLHKEGVRSCSFLYIIANKYVIISEAFLVDVSIYVFGLFMPMTKKYAKLARVQRGHTVYHKDLSRASHYKRNS